MEPAPEPNSQGVVVCRAGPNLLAFLAHQVVNVEPWAKGGARVAHARHAYALDAESGRLLRASGGEAVVVDALEVVPDPPPLLAAPPLCLARVGGSLQGFLAMQEGLCPLLNLETFAGYLKTLPEAGR